MEGDGEDASTPQDDTAGSSFCCISLSGYLCRRFGLPAKKVKSYILMSLLLKSEVLYALFVWYIAGLISIEPYEQFWRDMSLTRFLPYLWILKPAFAFVDDSMERCLKCLAALWRYICGGTVSSDKIGIRLGRKRCYLDNIVDFNRRYNIILVASEIGILVSLSVFISCLYYGNLMHNWGKSAVIALALCQIAAGATSEGIFCRYVQCNEELSEVQFISLRQLVVGANGLSTLLCIMWPFSMSLNFFISPMVLMNIYPVFLVFNTVSVLWVVLGDEGGYEEAVDMSKRAETTWSPKVTFAFVTLMVMAVNIRHRCVLGAYRTFEYPYIVLISTLLLGQLTKMGISYVLMRRLTLHGLINIAKFIFMVLLLISSFGEALITPPVYGYSSIWTMATVFLVTTSVQHVLVTFGLALSVRTAPYSFESTITSLTDFSMDVVAFVYRENVQIRTYALRIFKYDAVVDALECFFCLYSYFAVFGKQTVDPLLHLGVSTIKVDQHPRLPKYFPVIEEPVPIVKGSNDYQVDVTSSVINSHNLLQDLDTDKSPWGVGSDYSDASD